MMLNPVFLLEPELAHALAILAIKYCPIVLPKTKNDKILNCSVWDLAFPNPLGIAAGFDKNGDCIEGLFSVGFGFVELGTITPIAQFGNDKPRVFRLIKDNAVINRMGFNNKGIEYIKENLMEYRKKEVSRSIIGVNIGKNAESKDYILDYIKVFDAVYPFVDYVTINVSSPNTKGLRDLQNYDSLVNLLLALKEKKSSLLKKYGDKKIFVKISPDIEHNKKENLALAIVDGKADGIVATNTTIDRPFLLSKNKIQSGGLSGEPLFDLSTSVLRDIYSMTEGKIPIIGVGGIHNAETAYKKIKMGASLIQLYSSMIYQGLSVIKKTKNGLADLLRRDGFSNISQAVGLDVDL